MTSRIALNKYRGLKAIDELTIKCLAIWIDRKLQIPGVELTSVNIKKRLSGYRGYYF